MAHLKDLLGGPSERKNVVDDCLELIEGEVKDKSGLSGMAIKGGYAVVNGFKPSFVRDAVDHLLPDFSDKLDPIYQEAVASGKDLETYFGGEKSRIADALLAITDERAKKSKHTTVVKTYEKLRGTGKSNVEAAVPRLAKLIKKYHR
jgi:hypothetical protein